MWELTDHFPTSTKRIAAKTAPLIMTQGGAGVPAISNERLRGKAYAGQHALHPYHVPEIAYTPLV
jgi:hypothetical protein